MRTALSHLVFSKPRTSRGSLRHLGASMRSLYVKVPCFCLGNPNHECDNSIIETSVCMIKVGFRRSNKHSKTRSHCPSEIQETRWLGKSLSIEVYSFFHCTKVIFEEEWELITLCNVMEKTTLLSQNTHFQSSALRVGFKVPCGDHSLLVEKSMFWSMETNLFLIRKSGPLVWQCDLWK